MPSIKKGCLNSVKTPLFYRRHIGRVHLTLALAVRLHQQRRETLVQTITYTVSKQFPQVKRIDVSVEKLNPPIDKFTGSAEVKYRRDF